jgi:glycosyltransferase involved in cell wall biosynthesis
MTEKDSIEISVVIPCLNEAETVVSCIKEAHAALRAVDIYGEVVVADNGSIDASRKLAEQAGARVVLVERGGYGNALKGGIASAMGRYVIMGDADGSYDFGELPRFLALLREGYDLVIGCRLPRGGGTIEPGAMPWKHRWIGNPILSGAGKLFFGAPVDDFHCGLRGFRRDAILALGLRTGGMEFASEMVVKATLAGLQIGQVPITLRPDRRSRPPHLRSWRDGWRHLRFMLLFSPNWLFLIPGIILVLLGGLGFLILLPGPLKVGAVTLDLNTLLVSSATLLLGFQTLVFGLFVKTYAANTNLLPGPKPRLVRLVEGRPVEYCALVGLIFILGGLVVLGRAVLSWQAAGFGPLSVQESLRMVISSVTGLTLGAQTIFSGFVLAVLGLER